MSISPPKLTTEDRLLMKFAEADSTLRYIFVEGIDDGVVCGKIAARIPGLPQPTAVKLGGRNRVIAFYERCLAEGVFQNENIQLLFMADRDTWIFDKIPEMHTGIHFTKGYSIENDLFEDGKERLLNPFSVEDRRHFEQIVAMTADWFAFECEKLDCLRLENPELNSDFEKLTGILVSTIFSTGFEGITESPFFKSRGYVPASEKYLNLAAQEPFRVLRGKYLFAIYYKMLKKGFRANKKSLQNRCIEEGMKNEDSNTSRIVGLLRKTFTGYSIYVLVLEFLGA